LAALVLPDNPDFRRDILEKRQRFFPSSPFRLFKEAIQLERPEFELPTWWHLAAW
jgi:hypothetical protein